MHQGKRLLLVAPAIFAPVQSGISRRLHDLVDALEGQGFEVHFLFIDLFRMRVGGSIDYGPMQQRLGKRFYSYEMGRTGAWWKRAITVVWRLVSSGAAGRWWLRLRERFSRGSSSMPVDVWFTDGLAEYVRSLGDWDVVVVAYVFLSRAFEAAGGNPLKVLDTNDIYTDRNLLLKGKARVSNWFTTDRFQEQRGVSRADRVLAISETDLPYFRDLTDREVHHLGCLMPIGERQRRESERPSLLLVGSDNPHNRFSLDILCQQILPQLEGVELKVAGPLSHWAPDGVQRLGEVDDLGSLYDQAWVCLNPDLGATGISVKSLEALHHGCPLVATPTGARGLTRLFEGALVVVELEEFVPALQRLLGDRSERIRLGQRALECSRLYQQHNQEALEAAFR